MWIGALFLREQGGLHRPQERVLEAPAHLRRACSFTSGNGSILIYLFAKHSLTKGLPKPIATRFSKETLLTEQTSKFSVVQGRRYLGLTKSYRLSPGCGFFSSWCATFSPLGIGRKVLWKYILFLSENPKCIQVDCRFLCEEQNLFYNVIGTHCDRRFPFLSTTPIPRN